MNRIFLSLPIILSLSGCMDYHFPPVIDYPSMYNPRPKQPVYHTDAILQITQPEVDVLWVVDDSCSMYEEQQRLATNFPIFFEFFEGSGLDYHIGVVSTDMDNAIRKGKLVTKNGYRYIDPETPNAAKTFADMSILGTSGSGTERGKDATYTALEIEKDLYNIGFLRDTSTVHVIVVTDEDDRSNIVTSDELGAYLNGIRQDPDDVTFSAIIDYNIGAGHYLPVKNLVGGIEWNILEPDWTDLLRELGLQAAGLKKEYFLSQLPVPNTIEVTVKYNELTFEFTEGEDWTYNPVRNSITFHEFVPEPLSNIIIRYQILSASEL